jgi:hypothetical protein
MSDFDDLFLRALEEAAAQSPPRNLSKDRFHTVYKKRLREIAEALGLTKGEYDIRSNKAGPAVLGEVILHGDRIYLQVGGLNQTRIMFRSVKSRKDYTGGPNNWMSLDVLWNTARCIPALLGVMSSAGSKKDNSSLSKYGGHGVDIKLTFHGDTQGGRVFWSDGNSYVIVADDRGEWRTSSGERVTLLSINGMGEVRSRAMSFPPAASDLKAANHFGLKASSAVA